MLPWLLSSRVMSIFAITSHQYTITLYTPGHLQISWDVFAKKSADILSFRISFITISTFFLSTSLIITVTVIWHFLFFGLFIFGRLYAPCALFWWTPNYDAMVGRLFRWHAKYREDNSSLFEIKLSYSRSINGYLPLYGQEKTFRYLYANTR